MSFGSEREPQAPQVARAGRGRLLGGVCAGLDGVRGISTNRWRVFFVLAGLCAGIGVVGYLACWLVIPGSDETADSESVRGVVLLSWATGGLVAVVLTAAISAAATVFGLGWIIVALAGIVLVIEFSPVAQRLPGFVALTAVAALTLPAAAVAISPLRLHFQDGALVSRPANAATVEHTTFTSGFGTQLIDLRRTDLPSSGTVTMHIHAGLRRTIVALPMGTCVHVKVNYAIHSFASNLATLVSGRDAPPFAGVVMFGDVFGEIPGQRQGSAVNVGSDPGPTLDVDFSSQGGSLYVRDYPDTVSPDAAPNWPGFHVNVEPKPDLRGESRKARKLIERSYHQRLPLELASQRRVNYLMPGPCAH